MIAIIDYQMGNLRSVQKGFEKVGHQAIITGDAAELAKAEKIVLPGVGAFADAIAELQRRELVEPIRQAVDSGKPFLGICPGTATSVRRQFRRRPIRGLGAFCPARSFVSICLPNTRCRTWAGIRSRSAVPLQF